MDSIICIYTRIAGEFKYLEKMINDPILSENDRMATVATAINKARILQKGLMKHSHEEEAERMTKKLAKLEALYD